MFNIFKKNLNGNVKFASERYGGALETTVKLSFWVKDYPEIKCLAIVDTDEGHCQDLAMITKSNSYGEKEQRRISEFASVLKEALYGDSWAEEFGSKSQVVNKEIIDNLKVFEDFVDLG